MSNPNNDRRYKIIFDKSIDNLNQNQNQNPSSSSTSNNNFQFIPEDPMNQVNPSSSSTSNNNFQFIPEDPSDEYEVTIKKSTPLSPPPSNNVPPHVKEPKRYPGRKANMLKAQQAATIAHRQRAMEKNNDVSKYLIEFNSKPSTQSPTTTSSEKISTKRQKINDNSNEIPLAPCIEDFEKWKKAQSRPTEYISDEQKRIDLKIHNALTLSDADNLLIRSLRSQLETAENQHAIDAIKKEIGDITGKNKDDATLSKILDKFREINISSSIQKIDNYSFQKADDYNGTILKKTDNVENLKDREKARLINDKNQINGLKNEVYKVRQFMNDIYDGREIEETIQKVKTKILTRKKELEKQTSGLITSELAYRTFSLEQDERKKALNGNIQHNINRINEARRRLNK
jgi:hypothetical protein